MIRALLIGLFALVASLATADAQFTPSYGKAHYFSAASTNSTSVIAHAVNVSSIFAANTTTTVYYLKIYDKASAPTCNTDTPILTIPVQGTAAGPQTAYPTPPGGLYLPSGLGFCITGGSADNDNTNAATGVTVDFTWVQ